jgi:hypothetical protein
VSSWDGGDWLTFGLVVVVAGFFLLMFTQFGRTRLLPGLRYLWWRMRGGR